MANAPTGTASIRDVARIAQVSVGTVSNVLNHPERVGSATRDKVESAIAQLGYVRNSMASQLRAGNRTTVGAIVLDLANPFFTSMARGLADRLALDGYALMLASSDSDPRREEQFIRLFIEHRVAGLAIVPHSGDLRSLEALAELRIDVVLLDATFPDSPYPTVTSDNVAGGRLAVGHLLDGGARQVMILTSSRGERQVAERLSGARQAVGARGRDPDEVLVLVNVDSLDSVGGQRAIERVMEEGSVPSAIFAMNDLVAIGAIRALRHGGAYDPARTAIVGYDDIDVAAELLTPLSSIRQPVREIGEAAAEILLTEPGSTGTRHVTFQPELVVRDSSARSTRG